MAVVKKLRKSTQHIKQSEQIIGQLYPVLIDSDTKEILDGRERLKVSPDWRSEEVEVPGETEEERELNRIRIKHIANWARKDIDHKADLTEIAKRTEWKGLKPFADFLGVPERTISRYLDQKYKDEVKSRSAQKPRSAATMAAEKTKKAIRILKDIRKAVEKASSWLDKTEEIASSIETTENILTNLSEKLGLTNTSIENTIDNWFNEIEADYSLWECLDQRPEGFGDAEFHGNCSPTIIAAVLRKYSSLEDKLIFDPMAGSGTFIDVARAMGYEDKQILARDIRPLREDIDEGDASDTKLPDKSVDFIFAHFPYWKIIEYTKDNPKDASRLSYAEFLEWSEKVIVEMKRILKKKKFLVVMIGNMRLSGVVDLEAELSIIGSKHLRLWDKIVKKIRTWSPETRGQRMGQALSRARQHNYSVVNHDTLLVFRKG